jgi:hypothetical protein
MQLPLTGGCVCGAIRYEIGAAPINVYACHCLDCQRVTSSAFSIGVVVQDGAFTMKGKEARSVAGGVSEGGRAKRRWVCPDCGTWLFGNPRPSKEYPGLIRVVRGGTLDDTSWLKPQAHYWTRSKQPWVILPEDVAVYERQPNR